MTFLDILDKYRTQSFSEQNKGTRFERLMKAWLLTAPQYRNVIQEVWMWSDFPFRKDFGSGNDVGIDLVARTVDGDYWAVQCKCYGDTQITKAAVDTFLSTSEKRFRDAELQQVGFTHRLWISTSEHWSGEAVNALQNLAIPVSKVSLYDLETSPVDWRKLEEDVHGGVAVLKERSLREHQQKAVNLFHEHFLSHDRGRLIMACGTGKTFTALRIAENETNGQGLVLFLVPSIALLNQTLIEWSTFAEKPIRPVCICSDVEASQKKTQNDDASFRIEDLALPATTNVKEIMRQFHQRRHQEYSGMLVVFSTYQSIDRIAEAQKALNQIEPDACVFDLIICDEAHRTTGVALKSQDVVRGGYDETSFTKVHDNDFLKARKRMYMTATPRLYRDDVKERAKEAEAYLCSMDDPAIYGEEVYRIGFGEAVEKDLLSDYKVLVLTTPESEIPAEFQKAIADSNGEIQADDIAKLIGCINALSKRMVLDEELVKASDPSLMHTAVAFCQKISVSKHIRDVFNQQKDTYYQTLDEETRAKLVAVEADHIDGTMGAAQRQEKLNWLKTVPTGGHACRILTNVRCLSEGVDVPSLDAVMFLSKRNSQVDVVQSVGRVMRKAPGKKYGYIIIPVIIPENMSAEDALDKSDSYAVVWTVLNALRAHDDRFNAEINKIELNRRPQASSVIKHTHAIGGGNGDSQESHIIVDYPPLQQKLVQTELNLKYENLQNVIFARMVKKVGTRRYWELWAKDVANIAEQHIARIHRLLDENESHRKAFDSFLTGLRKDLNPSVTKDEAVEMLAQHIITQPVFDALFGNYSFTRNNPISQAMQGIIDLLHEEIPSSEAEVMARFYKSIAERVAGINNAEGRQKVIVELYDKFFSSAFPKTVQKLGIVYTPVEVVDFIIHSVEDVLKKEFNRHLTDENVHILDPFTGTGTFLTRLLLSGLIKPKDLERKYLNELHANEIVLLAYYIASINIENVYHDLAKNSEYQAFRGICLTDTFQMAEDENDASNTLYSEMFTQNSKRVRAQKKQPIQIIIGNPPYSVGQKSANDNAQNQSYPKLERRIADTYAKYSTSTNKNSLYDSYIKAFRWASDRLADNNNSGIIAFVSNGAWIDGNATSGFRKCLADEFSSIYVFNLRGNCRTSGEMRRKEGDNVFGLGSRTPIAITLLVKRPDKSGQASIYYHDIGDYIPQNDKLKLIKELGSICNPSMELSSIAPNNDNDWVNQRDGVFETFIPIGDKESKSEKTVFLPWYSCGVKTNRDPWVYNFSKAKVDTNISSMIAIYNENVTKIKQIANDDLNEAIIEQNITLDSTKISWNRGLRNDLAKLRHHDYHPEYIRIAMYRPFVKQHYYFDRNFNDMMYQIPKLFPTPQSTNLTICVSGIGAKTFSTFITNTIPDLHILESGSQCFPLYYYEKQEEMQLGLFDKPEEGFIKRDGITDFALLRAREMYGPKIIKEDLFYYVYGLLHSPDYRHRFASDLTKMLPRIPFVEEIPTFQKVMRIGRKLAELHLNYETAPFWPDLLLKGDTNNHRVVKMRFGKDGKQNDKRVIWLNDSLRVENIPLQAYEYVVNGKSALEWLMERYAVTTDKASGIVNDANAWGLEHSNPRYILDLLCSIVTVSMETLKLIFELPKLDFDKA
ncbi:MAG: DEAD/DEAH box helicase [Victivallales bacterium]|nr:DEAD/DEAH box helicase [Victivallales bacterium]